MKTARFMIVLMVALVAAFCAQPARAQEDVPLVEVQWSENPNQFWVTATGLEMAEMLGDLQIQGGETILGCWDLESQDEAKWKCFVDLTLFEGEVGWFGYVFNEAQPTPACVSHHDDWVSGDEDGCWWRRVTPVVTFTGSARNVITATLTGADPRELPLLQVAEDIENLREVDWTHVGEGNYKAVIRPVWVTGFKLTGQFVECSNHHEWWTLDSETCWMQGNRPTVEVQQDLYSNAGLVVVELLGSSGIRALETIEVDGVEQQLVLEPIDEDRGLYFAAVSMYGGEPVRGFHHFFLPNGGECRDYHDYWSPLQGENPCWFTYELPTVVFDGYAAVVNGHAEGNKGGEGNQAFGYALRDPNLDPITKDYRPWSTGSHDWLAGTHSMNPFPEGVEPDNVWEWWMEGVASCHSTTINWVVVNEDGSCSFRVGLNPEAIKGQVFLPILMR